MSIRIALADPPEFYTNLDVVTGSVVLFLSRPESIGAVVVKLEGESRTALAVPPPEDHMKDYGRKGSNDQRAGEILGEDHKILYKVSQVFPDEAVVAATGGGPVVLPPGQHEFPFRFKLPFNNACSDQAAMARLGGGIVSGPGFGAFGGGGIRVMDGTRQLQYRHVTQTLPPSFTGFPREAEIRYFVKVTVQRPGLFRENWRYQVGFKFLPIEPPRPPRTSQEAFARRPFAFRARSPATLEPPQPKRKVFERRSSSGGNSFFGSWAQQNPSPNASSPSLSPSSPSSPMDSKADPLLSATNGPDALQAGLAPSIEMSARLPHPSVLTCNQPLPLRLLAKKLAPSREVVYLTSLQIDLIGATRVRAANLAHTETTRWVVVSRRDLRLPLCEPDAPVGSEVVVPPDSLWRDVPLPNTVMPSFVTCNLSRSYQLELKLGLSWGLPPPTDYSAGGKLRGKLNKSRGGLFSDHSSALPQSIFLPLHFSAVEVYSGVAPPQSLLEAMSKQQRQPSRQQRRPLATRPPQQQQQQIPRPHSVAAYPPSSPATPSRPSQPQAPSLPVRPPPGLQGTVSAPVPAAAPAYDPLYPPQLAPGQEAAAYDDAPPSYDEAMAEEMTGPVIPAGQPRPAYSGVTNENAPLSVPEKS